MTGTKVAGLIRVALLLVWMPVAAGAQSLPLDVYLAGEQGDIDTAIAERANRDLAIATRAVDNILPFRRPGPFANYVNAKLLGPQVPPVGDLKTLAGILDALRLNKLVGSTASAASTTSLLSRVAVPAVLGFGVEYGGVLQQNTGPTTTMRANLLGVSRMLFGEEQFRYCPVPGDENCRSRSRHLRRFSASISFQNVRAATAAGTAAPVAPAMPTPSPNPIVTDLFGNDFRMASWGLRFDLTPSNNLDDPGYVERWNNAIEEMRGSQVSTALATAIQEVYRDFVTSEAYGTWAEEANRALRATTDEAVFRQQLEDHLDLLVADMKSAIPDFEQKILILRRAFTNYFTVRDRLLQEIQSHKMSVEYTNQHPQGQIFTSNLRFIYSHQPTRSPTLVTVNAAVNFYHSLPAEATNSRLRDFQLAGQIDRRLGQIPGFGYAVATFGGYYQWMKEDALITINSNNVAPGSGIVLPGTAATLLGTKGHIGIVQGKLSIPISSTVKVPISITWANRTELIKESDVRGQIGLTLDIDSLFQ